ncbi:diguanylate cyclase domain-containing protein [Massilia sp. GCM10020059]|uniref:Diguanylate cyclase n=1 Tax=Massilia agrisoli TaxID=2892444 RepID=A0ABS8J110_9BURK|nr:diguanylate cyclase [Massilia agrisoli]MCC6073204.1 diguanylate cyclase [Massilia agrisoli]
MHKITAVPAPKKTRTAPRLGSFVTLGVCAAVGLTMLAMLALVNHFAVPYATREAELRLQQLAWQMRDSVDRVANKAGGDPSLLPDVRSVPGSLQATVTDHAFKEYGAEIVVVRRDGTVLLGPAGMEGQKIATDSLKLALGGATGAVAETWPDGRTYFTGYARTGDPKDPAPVEWAVLARQPEATAMAGWDALKWRILWISLALGGALAWIATMLARKVTRPMNQLSSMMETRASGAAAGPVLALPDEYGFREAQVLSKAMWHMLEAESQHVRVLERMNEELEAKVAERTAELHAMAMSDTLTGLPNRRALMHVLPQAIKRAVRLRRSCAVLFLDLDGFKGVNDSYGHEEGDELLRQVGARIAASVRKTDTVARLAGDEFVVVLEMLPAPGDAEATARKILPQLRLPFALSNNVVTVSASIGVAVFLPDDAQDMAALLVRADQAMYVAKGEGKDCIALARTAREAEAVALD